MMIQRRIDEHFDVQVKDMSEDARAGAMKEIDTVRLWSDRRWDQVSIPSFCNKTVPRVIDRDGRPFEIETEIRYWPLEEGNKDLLFDLDLRIAGMLRVLKGLGIQRPPIVAHGMFFSRMYEREIADGYDGSWEKWGAVNLTLNRLSSTARIATRFAWFDDFGPLVTKKEGSVTYHYTKDLLAKELAKRGLMKRRAR